MYAVTSTVAVIDSSNKVIANLSLSQGVDYALFDSSNSKLYVAGSQSFTIIQGTKISTTVKTPIGGPSLLTYDPASKQIYFIGDGKGGVYLDALSTVTNKFSSPIFLVKTSCGYDCSYSVPGIVVNPSGGEVFVNTCMASPGGVYGNASVYDPSGHLVTYFYDNTGDGCYMGELADPSNGEMYILDTLNAVYGANGSSSNVFAVGSSGAIAAAFPSLRTCASSVVGCSGGEYTDLFYNPSNSEMYVTCSSCFGYDSSTGEYQYSTIAVSSKNTVVYSTVNILLPIVVDSANGDLWTNGIGSGTVLLNSMNKQVGALPFEVGFSFNYADAFAPTDKDLYFDNFTNLYVVTPANTVSNTFRFACNSMVFDSVSANVLCAGLQMILVLSS